MNCDSVNIGKHLLDDNRIKSVEVEAVAEDEMTRGEFSVGFTDNLEVLTGNKAEEGMVACLLVSTFPGLEKFLISFLTLCFGRHAADEVDPVILGRVLKWPRSEIGPTITDQVA